MCPSVTPKFINQLSLIAGLAGESHKDKRHPANVNGAGESLGLWILFASNVISQIAARTILHNDLTAKQAEKNLLQ